MPIDDLSDAARDSRRYGLLSAGERDKIADDWGCVIYFCCECDEANREPGDYVKCPRYPAEHDASGYMGTGETYPEDVRRLARLIADD